MKRTIHFALGALAACAAVSPFARAHAADCQGLTGKTIGGGVVTAAERWEPGHKFQAPGGGPLPPIAPVQVALCRVQARLSPVPESDIKVEVWLPEAWNGKLVGVGGGGFSGGLAGAPITLTPLVAQGYAGVATDVGHPAADGAEWAYKHPAQLVDYAHRGNHVAAQFARALVAAYYARPIQRAYFHGCSNGGRDALMEAWRYPQDYDGIVVGAPADGWTRLMTTFAWNAKAVAAVPGGTISRAKLKLVADTVLGRCDALDGVKDGVLENPKACRFDPRELQCKAGDRPDCLTAAEVKAMQAIYQGPRTSSGVQIAPGWPVGGEARQWPDWMFNTKSGDAHYPTEYFRWMVYGDPSWTLDRFDLERDFAAATKRTAALMNSDHPDLRPFLKHGGKLIFYHGWEDAAIQPQSTIDFYRAMTRTVGAASSQTRLFMVPGMGHCFLGEGPSRFDMVAALDKWFETGTAPERVIASKTENDMLAFVGLPVKTIRTRPLCAWPKQARWTGTGSTDEAANFRCVVAKPH